MRRLILFFVLYLSVFSITEAQPKTLLLKDIYIRDPFILPDTLTGEYYMYRSASVTTSEVQATGGVEVFTSKDLVHWKDPVQVLVVPVDNWTTGIVWAPEVHCYSGKYYLFATLTSPVQWKKSDSQEYPFRGTQIFWSESPTGPFLPFENKLPQTPMDEMALDGTLWVENGKPYMVYCNEWVQVQDGTMKLLPLNQDMSAPDGSVVRLFNSSAAPWSTGLDTGKPGKSYVTDGCFLYKTKTGKLLMIWSSFSHGEYAMGIAESVTGRITRPWKQQAEPLFTQNGGHGMIFTDFDGKLCLVLHSPNSPGGSERAHIFELEDIGNTLKLKNN